MKPCHNNGICINHGGGYECKCAKGYKAAHKVGTKGYMKDINYLV